MSDKIHICRYCKKQVLKRQQNYHAHCRRSAHRNATRIRNLEPSDIQEPINCVDTAMFDRLIAERSKEIRDRGLAFIRSRTPVDDSPAAEIVLRPAAYAVEPD